MAEKISSRALFWVLINGVLVVAMVAGLIGATWMLRSSNAIAPSRTITVSGEGKVEVVPDIATLTFSVISQGAEPAPVQKTTTEKMNNAIEFLKQKGIAKKDIQTSQVSLNPRYRWIESRGENEITGYEAVQTATVKIREFEMGEEIVAGLPGVGVNQISSYQFEFDDPEVQKTLAREEAFNNAWDKANAMAKAAGVRIARVVTFSESFGGYPPIYYAKEALAREGADMAAPPVPNLEPGQEEVMVNVSVTFEIR